MHQSSTVPDLLKLSASDRRTLHGLAGSLYQQEKCTDAERIFGVLCLANPDDASAWHGLGASRQRQRNYLGAAPAYAQSFAISGGNPWAPLHAAECWIALGRFQEAIAALEDAHRLAELADRPQEIRGRINALVHTLDKIANSQTQSPEGIVS